MRKIAADRNYRMLKRAQDDVSYSQAAIAKLESIIGTDYRIDQVKKMVAAGKGGPQNGEKELMQLVESALFAYIRINDPKLQEAKLPGRYSETTYAKYYANRAIHGVGPKDQFPNLLKEFGTNQPQPKPKTLEAMEVARTLANSAHQL